MSRDEFLLRVRSAAASGRAYRVHARAAWSPSEGRSPLGEPLVDRMAAEVELAGGNSQVVPSFPAAAEAVGRLLEHYQARCALCWQHSVLGRIGLDAVLTSRGVERLNYDDLLSMEPDEQRRKMLDASIGVTSATWAIAETGTLAMASAPGRERLTSLLPPVHVAVIEAAQILPDLFDLVAEFEAAGFDRLASNVTLITGPSKTGDLELRLVTGVHGPGDWHVIIVNESSPNG